MKTYKIYLIRHGLTEANEKGLYIGRSDYPLSPEGLTQLLQMKEVYTYPVPRRFYAPDLMRCRQTLEVLFPHCDVKEVPGLTECDFGESHGIFWICSGSLVYVRINLIHFRLLHRRLLPPTLLCALNIHNPNIWA